MYSSGFPLLDRVRSLQMNSPHAITCLRLPHKRCSLQFSPSWILQSGVSSITLMSLSLLAFRSFLNALILSSNSLSGITSSIFNGVRLNGSFGSESKWERIVERSTVVLDIGRMTGSVIKVYIKGSAVDRLVASLVISKRREQTHPGIHLVSLPDPLQPGHQPLWPS